MTFKMLWCSDVVTLPTGYAQVTRNVLNGFYKAGADILNLGFQNVGFETDLILSNRMLIPWKRVLQIHPNENYGNQGSVEYYNNGYKPDYTAFLADSFMIKWLTDNIGDGKKRRSRLHGKTLFYFPFDSQEVYTGAKEVMEVMDIRVAMSKFAQKLLKDQTGMDSHYIPHGVDTTIYRPLPKVITEEARKQNGWENKFVVGCVGRNQSRKNLPAMMKAFQKFAEDKKDAVLFLHADPVDPQGTNLMELSKKLGISDRVIFGLKRFSQGLTEQKVNLIYNMMDIHCLTTTGEGFGLPIIESMAAGIPNICTNYTTAKELIGNDGELVDLSKGHPHIVGQLNTDRALVDIDDMTAKMNKLYDNPELRQKYSERGRRRILKDYSWDKIMRMWLELLEFGEITK